MRYLIYLMLLTATSLNAGSIHKWTDDDGNVHYSDSPPLSVKTENVRVQAAPSNPGKALPRLSSPDTKTTASKNSTDTANNDNQVPDDQAKIACENAQQDLRTISRSNRIKLRLDDGSTRYMTTEEIEDRKAEAEADLELFCQ